MIINVEIIILSSQFIKPAKYEEITVYQIALFESTDFHFRKQVTQLIYPLVTYSIRHCLQKISFLDQAFPQP